jgi:hypothetical protein
MSAIPRPKPENRAPDARSTAATSLRSSALSFAQTLMREQSVPRLARRTTSCALALLLEQNLKRPGEPVVLSAQEGARACSFEPRTWWLVKRRLLSLGHLVASTGGGPPSGRPGGRGHKAAYFVAPATLARFKQACTGLGQTLNARGKTLNDFEETGNAPTQTVKALSEEPSASRERGNPSHHRSLRGSEERTSNVLSFEEYETTGDDVNRERATERPTVEAIWAQAKRERSLRIKLRLLRLLESLLLAEALEKLLPGQRSPTTLSETVNGAPKEPPPGTTPPQIQKGRRSRSSTPLWTVETKEEEAVFSHARSILEWANRDFGARFDLERSSKDMLRYPFESVRGAVSNVLLKKSRGYRFQNPGAVLWDGISLEGYKLDEFSVARFDEVLARLPAEPKTTLPPKTARPSSPPPPSFESERKRRLLLQEIYERLPKDVREEVDKRAQALAEEDLGKAGSQERLALRRLDHRNILLEARLSDATDGRSGSEESQISILASERDESEPIAETNSRT